MVLVVVAAVAAAVVAAPVVEIVVVDDHVDVVDLNENLHSPTSFHSLSLNQEDVSTSMYLSLDLTSTEPSAVAAITLGPDQTALLSLFRSPILVLFGVISVDLLHRSMSAFDGEFPVGMKRGLFNESCCE